MQVPESLAKLAREVADITDTLSTLPTGFDWIGDATPRPRASTSSVVPCTTSYSTLFLPLPGADAHSLRLLLRYAHLVDQPSFEPRLLFTLKSAHLNNSSKIILIFGPSFEGVSFLWPSDRISLMMKIRLSLHFSLCLEIGAAETVSFRNICLT